MNTNLLVVNVKKGILSPVEVARSLESIPQSEVRGVLVATGLIANSILLKEATEQTLSFTGGEEHSVIISALKPKEFGRLIAASEEIFNSESLFLMPSEAEGSEGKWRQISQEEKVAIVASGDLKVVQRLSFFFPDPTKTSKVIWQIYEEDVALLAGGVQAYFSAVCNAEKGDKWKTDMAKAIGVDLLAFALREKPEIFDDCYAFNPSLALEIKKASERNEVGKAFDEYYQLTHGESDAQLVLPDEKVMDMRDSLRNIGKSVDVELNAALRNGI